MLDYIYKIEYYAEIVVVGACCFRLVAALRSLEHQDFITCYPHGRGLPDKHKTERTIPKPKPPVILSLLSVRTCPVTPTTTAWTRPRLPHSRTSTSSPRSLD